MQQFCEFKISDRLYEMDIDTQNLLKTPLRHGLSLALNKIRESVKQQAMSSGFNYNGLGRTGYNEGSITYGTRPLIDAIKARMSRNYLIGWVDTLGDTKNNDGTWITRFFSTGTKKRYSKNGDSSRYLGKIRPTNFFEKGISNQQMIVDTTIQRCFEEGIEKLNKKYN